MTRFAELVNGAVLAHVDFAVSAACKRAPAGFAGVTDGFGGGSGGRAVGGADGFAQRLILKGFYDNV